MTFPNRDVVQTARGNGQGAVHDACYAEQWCLVLLISADAMGAMFEPGPQEQGCDQQNDLAVKEKAFIQWQNGAADGGGRAARLQAGARLGERGVGGVEAMDRGG